MSKKEKKAEKKRFDLGFIIGLVGGSIASLFIILRMYARNMQHYVALKMSKEEKEKKD